ncbi:MAG TPA: adenylyl-sulfate kinase [Gemmatimonadales bacterium]|jgi:adenylylsulfate kinase|nr:adenylyl-sulfate kinase [Gemmatimonadales bacterium]
MFRESHSRSVAKALSWRIFGTIVTSALVYVFTRRLVVSLAVGAVEFLSKIGLFWLHERLWDRLSWGKKRVAPAVIWLTGLPGSGKSTVADWVADQLRHRGLSVERLDGDGVRRIFPETGFTRMERDAHLRRIGYLASKLEEHGVFVVASFVSPYADSRQFVREQCSSFLEVYVSTPLEECERRDPKGLYARARRGEIANFTGVSDPYEPPPSPEVSFDTSQLSVAAAGAQVLKVLAGRQEI